MFQIAWITLRRITEKSLLVQLGVLAAVLVYLALGLDSVILNEAAGSEQSGIFVVFLFLSVFTIFWTTIAIPREIGRKEVHVYLSKPITRLHYLLGKFLGMAGMAIVAEALLLAIFTACLMIKGQPVTAWFFFAAGRTALFLVLLSAICTMVSVLIAEVPAMVAVLAIAAAGSVVFALPVLTWASFQPTAAAGMMSAYWLLPNLLHYRWEPSPPGFGSYLGNLLLYTTGWCALSLALAYVILRRRDLP